MFDNRPVGPENSIQQDSQDEGVSFDPNETLGYNERDLEHRRGSESRDRRAASNADHRR